jgi:NADH-quinone oxidoreductase subunit E
MSVRRLAADQPEGFAFTPENLDWAKAEIKKYPEGRQASAVLSLLWRAQEQIGGWISEPALRAIADMLGMAYVRVYEIVTFYTMFNLAPVGRYYVQVCGTTPCMLRGADDIKAACRKHIGPKDTVSADGMFSWTEVECLGACVNAPMAQINKYYYEDLTPENFEDILARLRKGEPVEPGPQNGRITSAPLSGPNTLTDAAIFAKDTSGPAHGCAGPDLMDAEAKRPGAAANARAEPGPKRPGKSDTKSAPAKPPRSN